MNEINIWINICKRYMNVGRKGIRKRNETFRIFKKINE